MIEKVTVFVICRAPDGDRLLLFEHPSAGIQIPAGTVEVGEGHHDAALREAREETGLSELRIERYLGWVDEPAPEGYRIVAAPTRVFSRPDETSLDWATMRRGIKVRLEREAPPFAQVTYVEMNQLAPPRYVTYQITGWVREEVLAAFQRRHFYRARYEGPVWERWEIETDHHRFKLFWAPTTALPPIVQPQAGWLTMLGG